MSSGIWYSRCGSVSSPWLRRRLVLHASVFETVGPFTTRALMAVLEMLSEMISSKELLRLVTLAELVDVV